MLAKVCLVGPKGVGKSTLAWHFDKNVFSEILRGTNLISWNMALGNYKVDLQMWDTCGEDRFRCMGPIYYKATNAALCMFDITSKQSFLDLQAWVVSVQQNANDDCIFVLIGNKSDLKEIRQVSAKEARKYAESFGASYFEICSLTGEEGVTEVFRYIAKGLLRQHDCYKSYQAKLAISSSGMGVTSQILKRKKWRNKRGSCLACLYIRST